MTDKKLEEYKAKYKEVYKGNYTFTDFKNNIHTIEFHFKKPEQKDVEIFQSNMQKNVTMASRNLIVSLLVDDEEKQKIFELEKEYPAISIKIIETFNPFLGITGESKVEQV
jgi:hypothetical protein